MRENVKTVLFDLDGTLLPMDQEAFTNAYFGHLAKWMAPFGYEPQALIKAVWKGTAAMVANDGTMTNEDRFWEVFDVLTGRPDRQDYAQFEEFYEKGFPLAKASTGYDPEAGKIVKALKEKGYTVVLATNPIFPSVATEQRIRWAGINREDLTLVTTYENSCFCKPDPRYYKEITEKLGIDPAECAMIGNDAGEDLPAAALGMDVFLLTRDLINTKNIDISAVPQGDDKALKVWLGL